MPDETPSPVSVVSLDTLALDPANLRVRDDRAKDTLRASLKRFGAGRSIVFDAKGVVVAGNGTMEAARQEGFTEALIVKPKPGQLVAVQRDEWTNTEAIAYGLADNRLSELAGWSADLPDVLLSLESEGFDLDTLGFSTDEVEFLLGDDEDGGDATAEGEHEADTESVAEPSQAPEPKGSLYPLAVTLTRQQYQRWKAKKEELKTASDTVAFLAVAGLGE